MTDKYFFNNQGEMQDEIWRLRRQRDRWQRIAERYEHMVKVMQASHDKLQEIAKEIDAQVEEHKRALQP